MQIFLKLQKKIYISFSCPNDPSVQVARSRTDRHESENRGHPFSRVSGIVQIFLQSIIKERSKSLSSGQNVQVGRVSLNKQFYSFCLTIVLGM